MVPEADGGRRALRSALARAPVPGVRLDPSGVEIAELTGDVIVELVEEEALGDLLRALHEISPQVFISRVGPREVLSRQPIKIRKLARIGAVRG